MRSTVANGDVWRVPVEVLASALRILTLDIWVEPETSDSAQALLRRWVNASGAQVVSHDARAWSVMCEFARTLSLRARAVPDALLAASAISTTSTLVTFDRGMARYPGLRTELLPSV